MPEILRSHIRALAAGREPEAPLFGRHWRDWPSAWTRRICDVAKVPRVPAHGLRGTASTLATEAGAVGHLIAAQLGHASEAVAAVPRFVPCHLARMERICVSNGTYANLALADLRAGQGLRRSCRLARV